MNRRTFLTGLMATLGGILVPWEPRRVYPFDLATSQAKIAVRVHCFTYDGPLSGLGAAIDGYLDETTAKGTIR